MEIVVIGGLFGVIVKEIPAVPFWTSFWRSTGRQFDAPTQVLISIVCFDILTSGKTIFVLIFVIRSCSKRIKKMSAKKKADKKKQDAQRENEQIRLHPPSVEHCIVCFKPDVSDLTFEGSVLIKMAVSSLLRFFPHFRFVFISAIKYRNTLA